MHGTRALMATENAIALMRWNNWAMLIRFISRHGECRVRAWTWPSVAKRRHRAQLPCCHWPVGADVLTNLITEVIAMITEMGRVSEETKAKGSGNPEGLQKFQ